MAGTSALIQDPRRMHIQNSAPWRQSERGGLVKYLRKARANAKKSRSHKKFRIVNLQRSLTGQDIYLRLARTPFSLKKKKSYTPRRMCR